MKNFVKTASAVFTAFLTMTAWGQIPQIGTPAPSVAVSDNALSVRVNPAGLAMERAPEVFLLSYSRSGSFERNGAFYGSFRRFGLGAEFVDEGPFRYNRYFLGAGISLGYGLEIGFSYNWYRHLAIKSGWNLGLMFRPYEYVSFGILAENLNSPRAKVGIPSDIEPLANAIPAPVEGRVKPRYNFGLALRPAGERFTLSADASLIEDPAHSYGDSLDWTLRAGLGLTQGVNVTLDFKPESKYFGAGLDLSFSHIGAGIHNYSDRGGGGTGSVYQFHYSWDRRQSLADPEGSLFVESEFSGPIVEEPVPEFFFGAPHPSLQRVTKALRELETDDRVGGLILRLGALDCGMAVIQELRGTLVRFQESGKILIVHSEFLGNKEYYLASAADQIYMSPSGFLNLTGLAFEVTFIKGTLDKLGIVAELENIGDYKSAAENLTREGMSQAHREELDAALESLFDEFTSAIALDRGLKPEELGKLIDGGPYSAGEALNQGLIDSILFPDQLEEEIIPLYDDASVLVRYGDYRKYEEYGTDWGNPLSKRIAVIFADGTIVGGRSSYGFFQGKMVGAETLTDAIREARENPMVKAIVMRVNSPGGDGAASDLIWREVQRTVRGAVRKPFIVSMGSVAASGGYYISCAADTIVADPATITGSIGVVSGKFDLSGFYEKIGFSREVVKKGERADFFSSARGWSAEEREHHRKMAREFYQRFIERVSEGRDLAPEQVEEVAQGRIWTGEQAWEMGLVDEIGSFSDAVQIAMGAAGFELGESALFEFYPKYPWMDFKLKSGPELRSQLNDDLWKIAGEVKRYSDLYDGKVLYLMPYEMKIE